LGSLELSLTYDHTIHTDITDCYGAIYTHSISWALHSKNYAKDPKNRKNKKLIGNIIDTHIQDMQYGQTNGLPQGSVLMDFVAEMVLGYADVEIFSKIATHEINDYQILRYRDDYRIFTNSSQDGERILKCITEVLIEIGMKLGAAKTKLSNSVVEASIKRDKIDWICRKQSEKDFHKHLLIIHNHSTHHPNSGSLVRALSEYHKKVISIKTIYRPFPIIGVLTDIAFHNPRVYPYFAAILSKILKSLPPDQATNLVEKIKSKFDKLPNTGHVQLWLQRITHPFAPSLNFEEPLCNLVSGETSSIWNDGWIASQKLLSAIKSEGLIDHKKLSAVPPIISVEEISVFSIRTDS
jgi:RNA-directed DNA polymerase